MFYDKSNRELFIKPLTKQMALIYSEKLLNLLSLIPYIHPNIEELFMERNPNYSKWKHSLGVFDQSGELIGVLLAYYREKDEQHTFSSLYIHRLAIDKRYQRSGIATEVIKFFIESSFHSNTHIEQISIQTNYEINNQYVIDFYKKIGFEEKYLIQYPNKLDILMSLSRSEYSLNCF